jgi:NADH-quinone oxidoreductase subunit N
MSIVYGITGSTALVDVRGSLLDGNTAGDPNRAAGEASRFALLAQLFIVAGIGFRCGLVPFHFGIPEIFEGSTAWVAGWMATVPRAAGVFVLVRLLVAGVTGTNESGLLIAILLAGTTIVVGHALAMFETRIRRLFAYTTMAHGGYVFLALAVVFWDAAHPAQNLFEAGRLPGPITASVFWLLTYLPAAAGLFALLTYLTRRTEQIEFLDDLAGLIRYEPLAAGCAVVLLLSLLGLPPLPGFWAGLITLTSLLSVAGPAPDALVTGTTLVPGTSPVFQVLIALAGAGLLMNAVVYLRLIRIIVFDSALGRSQPTGGRTALAAGLLATLFTLGVGLMPGPILGMVDQVQTSLSKPRKSPRSGNRQRTMHISPTEGPQSTARLLNGANTEHTNR